MKSFRELNAGEKFIFVGDMKFPVSPVYVLKSRRDHKYIILELRNYNEAIYENDDELIMNENVVVLNI